MTGRGISLPEIEDRGDLSNEEPVLILQSWIHWGRGRRPFYNKIGEVGGRGKIVGGKSEKHGRLISAYFYAVLLLFR